MIMYDRLIITLAPNKKIMHLEKWIKNETFLESVKCPSSNNFQVYTYIYAVYILRIDR